VTRLASGVVRLSARLLPASLRDRHREEWLADLRDAEEAGIPSSEIAIGSLAFALSTPRPIERRRREPDVHARSRLASALALSAAVVTVSQVGNAGSHEGLTGNLAYDITVNLSTALLLLYLVVAPIAALGLVILTRRVPGKVRAAVGLLVTASVSAIPLGLINSVRESNWLPNVFLLEGAVVLALPVALITLACFLLARQWSQKAGQKPNLAIVVTSAVAPLALLGLGTLNVLTLRAQLRAADVAFVSGLPEGALDESATLLAQGAQSTTAAIAVWAAVALIACLCTGIAAYVWPRHAIARLFAVLCVLLISHAGVLSFVWLNSFGGPGVHLTVSEVMLMLVGRWGIIAVVLIAVGGVRYRAAKRVSA
jgi:hypothetical protein